MKGDSTQARALLSLVNRGEDQETEESLFIRGPSVTRTQGRSLRLAALRKEKGHLPSEEQKGVHFDLNPQCGSKKMGGDETKTPAEHDFSLETGRKRDHRNGCKYPRNLGKLNREDSKSNGCKGDRLMGRGPGKNVVPGDVTRNLTGKRNISGRKDLVLVAVPAPSMSISFCGTDRTRILYWQIIRYAARETTFQEEKD